jgi:hypothetical protein
MPSGPSPPGGGPIAPTRPAGPTTQQVLARIAEVRARYWEGAANRRSLGQLLGHLERTAATHPEAVASVLDRFQTMAEHGGTAQAFEEASRWATDEQRLFEHEPGEEPALSEREPADAEAEDAEAPRLRPGEAFDPKKRRPNLSDFPNVSPAGIVKNGGKGGPVRVFQERVPERLRAERDRLEAILTDPNATPDQRRDAGNAYERLLSGDLGEGKNTPMRSSEGDKLRIGDEGVHEFTIEGQNEPFGGSKLDQLWRDLVARNQVMLTVPSLHPIAEMQIRQLAAIWEQVTGRRPLIIIRTTLP